MRTQKWFTKRVGTGKYNVFIGAIGDDNHIAIPGMILGGNGKWVVQIGGNQLQQAYSTINDAAAIMVSQYFGI